MQLDAAEALGVLHIEAFLFFSLYCRACKPVFHPVEQIRVWAELRDMALQRLGLELNGFADVDVGIILSREEQVQLVHLVGRQAHGQGAARAGQHSRHRTH